MRGIRLSSLTALSLGVALALFASSARAQIGGEDGTEHDVALARASATANRCHCPCSLSCGAGVTCNCMEHPADCHKCACARAEVGTNVVALLAEARRPALEVSFAPWFDAELYAEIKAGVTLEMADTGREESFVVRWVQDPASPWQYVPDASFDRNVFASWVARAKPGATGRLYAAVNDDPATYRILDGDPNHLGHSLEKTVNLVLAPGTKLPVFRSDSTLGWEMTTYLQQTVVGLDPSAFAEDAADVRSKMLGRVDTIDLQIKGGDYEAALATLDALIGQAKEAWLVEGNRHAESAICAFNKLRNLLAPGTQTCG